jgi:hypothetical protein
MSFADESEIMSLTRFQQYSTEFRGLSELVSSLPCSQAGGDFPIVSAESSNLVAPQFFRMLVRSMGRGVRLGFRRANADVVCGASGALSGLVECR